MSAARTWSTPESLRAQLQRMWDDGRLLAARSENAALFPLTLRLRQPSVAELGDQFDAVRSWIKAFEAGAKPARLDGYQIIWREINHRQLGRNRIPDAVLIESDSDALRLIGRLADARRFDRLAQATLDVFPQLRDWLAKRALTVLANADEWERILAVLRWFVQHPRPGLYLRQLDLEGVDSKFIETRKALLIELLDQVLPVEAVTHGAIGARQFEARYGLLCKPVQLRFRVLDPALAIGGLTDLTVPVAHFAALRTAVKRVFITENEINGLAFPASPGAIVIFGGGYGINRLSDIDWLRQCDIVYWGDIDTHGFAILDRLRAYLPQTRSLLMDDATLHAHRQLWGHEESAKRFEGDLARLTPAELALFKAVRDNVHGERVRLEQERIGFQWAARAIALA